MRILYENVAEKLKKLDFEAIYPGFYGFPFALYDDERVYFADGERDRTQQFYGNTAIEYDGRQMAIWHVTAEDRQDVDVFAGKMVHEMFHAFQKESGMVSEWPNDLKMLCYPGDEENFLMKLNENRLLSEGAFADSERKREVLAMVKASRSLRRARIGEYLEQEMLVEMLEGMAECSGMLALKQLSREKYEQQLQDYAAILRDAGNTFDIRRISYYAGAVMQLLERAVGNDQAPFHRQLEAHLREKEERVQAFFESKPTEHLMDTWICGYDPMNQLRVGDVLLAKNMIFLMIDGQPTMLRGPIALKMKPGSEREIVAYYQ